MNDLFLTMWPESDDIRAMTAALDREAMRPDGFVQTRLILADMVQEAGDEPTAAGLRALARLNRRPEPTHQVYGAARPDSVTPHHRPDDWKELPDGIQGADRPLWFSADFHVESPNWGYHSGSGTTRATYNQILLTGMNAGEIERYFGPRFLNYNPSSRTVDLRGDTHAALDPAWYRALWAEDGSPDEVLFQWVISDSASRVDLMVAHSFRWLPAWYREFLLTGDEPPTLSCKHCKTTRWDSRPAESRPMRLELGPDTSYCGFCWGLGRLPAKYCPACGGKGTIGFVVYPGLSDWKKYDPPSDIFQNEPVGTTQTKKCGKCTEGLVYA